MESSGNDNNLSRDTKWIGPTHCDYSRTLREKEIDAIWEIIKPAIEQLTPRVILISLSLRPLDLFREALNCYQNGAFAACSIMCRSAIDSLLYTVVANKITTESSADTIPDYTWTRRMKILDAVVSAGLLTKEDRNTVLAIWKEGDFVAHYSQNIDRANFELEQIREEVLNLQREYPDQKYWIGEKDVSETLSCTARIISRILNGWHIQYSDTSSIDGRSQEPSNN